MNGYDFDKTIYKNDSFTEFYFFCLIRRLYLIIFLPYQLLLFLLFAFKIISRKNFKQCFSVYLALIFGKEKLIKKFWEKNKSKIKSWYLNQQKPDDVVISASPRFLLEPIITQLNISHLICTEMNMKSGKITGNNCYGQEKVVRFQQEYGVNAKFEKFYSDSYSDLPIMNLSNERFLVDGDNLTKIEINL